MTRTSPAPADAARAEQARVQGLIAHLDQQLTARREGRRLPWPAEVLAEPRDLDALTSAPLFGVASASSSRRATRRRKGGRPSRRAPR